MHSAVQASMERSFGAIADLVRLHALHTPDHAALADASRTLDYRALDALMDRIAASLQRDGLKAGDAIEVKYMQNKTTKKVQLVRGVVLGKSNKGLGTNFKMRNIIGGIPVEWQYALYSPLLKGIRVLQEDFIHKGKKRTRRSKIYYLRDRPDSWSTVTADFAKAMTLKNNSAAAKAAAAAKKAKTAAA